MSTPENPVIVATVGAAHGIRGEVRVTCHADDPQALVDYSPLHAADGRTFTVVSAKPSKNIVIMRIAGVSDRDQAEALNGLDLFVDRSLLDDGMLEDDEFFHADLIGVAVADAGGKSFGTVSAVHDFGAGTILEIELPTGRSEMIPFTQAAVPEMRLAERIIIVEPVAAGLVELDDDGNPIERKAGSGSRRRRPPRKKPGGHDGGAPQ